MLRDSGGSLEGLWGLAAVSPGAWVTSGCFVWWTVSLSEVLGDGCCVLCLHMLRVLPAGLSLQWPETLIVYDFPIKKQRQNTMGKYREDPVYSVTI